MSSFEAKPILHSDLDGTAVEIAAGPLQNMRKYPLSGIPGYRDFVLGVRDAGVDLGNIVTRRPDDPLGQRRRATERSLEDIGVSDLFDPEKAVLAGKLIRYWESEEAKGIIVAADAHNRVVGMIDDKPHKIGMPIIRALAHPYTNQTKPVVLGVVASEYARTSAVGLHIEASQYYLTEEANELGDFRITDGIFTLDVVQLPQYSFEAGSAFGALLLDRTVTVETLE